MNFQKKEVKVEHIGNLLPKCSGTVSTGHCDDPVPECPICNDAGFIHPLKEDGKPDFSQVIPCKCRDEQIKLERNQRLIKLCELPDNTERLTFENFQRDQSLKSMEEAYKAALELAEESSELKWLILIGNVDVGKTHLAIAICRRWLVRGKPARYVFIPDMLEDLRQGYNPDAEMAYYAQLQFLKNVPLLVLDDLGAGKITSDKGTSWAVEKLEIIIDHRYINGLPLVVTTNKEIDKVVGDFSQRIASRLMRFVPGRVVVMEAPEYRTRRGK